MVRIRVPSRPEVLHVLYVVIRGVVVAHESRHPEADVVKRFDVLFLDVPES